MYPILEAYIKELRSLEIPAERKKLLQVLIEQLQKKQSEEAPLLNFICTHNSRRSQLAQIWAHTASIYFNRPIRSRSGGTEQTAFHPNAVKAIKNSGFKVEPKSGKEQDQYLIYLSDDLPPLKTFSKTFDHPDNQASSFTAVMCCSDANENCPFVPGAEARIPLFYSDPKTSDGTDRESEAYANCCKQIGSEMFYVFSQLNGSDE